MDAFEKKKKIGAGTYGVVYSALWKKKNQLVALKKIRILDSKQGISFSAIREIKCLQDLHHENVVSLLEVFSHKQTIMIAFELMETDLENVIKDQGIFFSPSDIKSYLQMILKGANAVHKNWILHRDLKPNNLLISKDGILKLADFGNARHYGSPNPRFTSTNVTIWYRSPELLFGAKAYGPSVDIWSIGCIFAEMMLRTPYFPGDNEFDQLAKIFAALGTPTEEQWPDMKTLMGYVSFTYCPPTPLKLLFSAASDDALDLLGLMLRFNPSSRCTAEEALNHPFFSNSPAPTVPANLPRPKGPIGTNHATQSPASPSKRPGDSLDGRPPVRRKIEVTDEVKRKLDFS
eukprot:TRINITY_DN2782_c0_g3_i2.p1 TRINITY_DN2782_c0_g3~~TRINITY_DN2782_c0_g3_i2.p1  ORF type:complete len:358 (+),score=135.31 TRINITY_DN2782_c0_g3_i2:35-1075(+)